MGFKRRGRGRHLPGRRLKGRNKRRAAFFAALLKHLSALFFCAAVSELLFLPALDGQEYYTEQGDDHDSAPQEHVVVVSGVGYVSSVGDDETLGHVSGVLDRVILRNIFLYGVGDGLAVGAVLFELLEGAFPLGGLAQHQGLSGVLAVRKQVYCYGSGSVLRAIAVLPDLYDLDHTLAKDYLSQFTYPWEALKGIKDFILETVEKAGPNPCPPIVVGVGIGGNFDHVALLAKKALLRPVDSHNEDPFYAQLEDEMLEKINQLGIGPQGFGGRTTAVGVNIETLPTHIAGMPCAVNISCHVTRHESEVI